jgi:uncharacterized Rossmann fold enzyme
MYKMCHDWKARYLELAKWLDFDLRDDLYALSLAEMVSEVLKLPRFECLEVVGPAQPKRRSSCPVMAVDGVVKTLKESTTVLVTDLDGADEHDVEDVLLRGGYVFLHVHGDNYWKALDTYLKFKGTNRIVLTVQYPHSKALCVPALSDGSRALVISALIANEVYVSGFDYSNITKIPKDKLILPHKERKLRLSLAYEVLCWQRFYGELRGPVIGLENPPRS